MASERQLRPPSALIPDGPRAARPERKGPSVVILAAGTSSRFAGTKQLARIGGKTLIQRIVDAVPMDSVREIIVVVGHDARSVSRALRGRKEVRIVVNKNYSEGIGTSIRAGVLALAGDTRGAMILLSDQPFVTRALLERAIKLFEDESESERIIAVAHGGVVSPPVIFSRKYFRELVALYGDHGAKFVVLGHAGELSLVKVRSKASLIDVDTREDLEAARWLLVKARKTR